MSTITKTIDEKRVDTITLTINGEEVSAKKGATVLRQPGVLISTFLRFVMTLTSSPMELVDSASLKLKECVDWLALARHRATEGMVVHTETPRVNQARCITMELIIANHHGDCLTCVTNQQCEVLKSPNILV